VASAEELIREAQHALGNVSPGSADERKNSARAKKYAKRVIRKYPGSSEAIQAAAILGQLNESFELAGSTPNLRVAEFLKNHASNHEHFKAAPSAGAAGSANADSWVDFLRRFSRLPNKMKNYLALAAFIALVFPGSFFVFAALAILYVVRPDLLKKHLQFLLSTLGQEQ